MGFGKCRGCCLSKASLEVGNELRLARLLCLPRYLDELRIGLVSRFLRYELLGSMAWLL